jgi:hypothetical protein
MDRWTDGRQGDNIIMLLLFFLIKESGQKQIWMSREENRKMDHKGLECVGEDLDSSGSEQNQWKSFANAEIALGFHKRLRKS